jgi:hypothetical protein
MPDKPATSLKAAKQDRSQISGRRKAEFIRGVLQQRVPDLDDEVAAQITQHLSEAIASLKAERTLIERYRKPEFDPYAFSLMKVYRTKGESGLRERLRGIEESGHLQALAKAQQISLPHSLRNLGADAVGLKEAIVRGVISRYEDWQAAS